MLKLENDLKEQFLEPKKAILVDLLVDFIENKAPKLIANPADLKVLNFEYDYPPFCFCYSGYPDPNIIPLEYWLDQFTLDVNEADDENKLSGILANNDIIEIEGFKWIDTKTGKKVNLYAIYGGLEDVFFAECWKIAKKKTNSGYRCFFLLHDIYQGIDADTERYADSDDVIKILTDEGFEFEIFDAPENTEPPKIIHPWWKFW